MGRVAQVAVVGSQLALNHTANTQQTTMGWLQTHLETFVKPVLGEVPTLSKDHHIFTPQEMSVIKNMWRSVKTEAKRLNKTILLAGRDVWIFEVLARREGTLTVFRPDISRLTSNHITEDYAQHYLFDTGFMGSIPRALGCQAYTMGSSNSVRMALRGLRHATLHQHDTKQIFPRLKGARSLILKIERTPKYWKRAYYRDPELAFCNCPTSWGRLFGVDSPEYCATCNSYYAIGNRRTGILQDPTEQDQFRQAAMLTIEIYKDSSPAFVDGPTDVGGFHSGLVGYD